MRRGPRERERVMRRMARREGFAGRGGEVGCVVILLLLVEKVAVMRKRGGRSIAASVVGRGPAARA